MRKKNWWARIMAKYICKYCEKETENSDCVCGTCRNKLQVVRKLMAMLAPYKKVIKNESKNK